VSNAFKLKVKSVANTNTNNSNLEKIIGIYIQMDAPVRIHYIKKGLTYTIDKGKDTIDGNIKDGYTIKEEEGIETQNSVEAIAQKSALYEACKIEEFKDAICVEFYKQDSNDISATDRAKQFHKRATEALQTISNYKILSDKRCRTTVSVLNKPNSAYDNLDEEKKQYNSKFSYYVVFRIIEDNKNK